MSWSHVLAIVCFLSAAAIFIFTAIPQRQTPSNRRVPRAAHPSCRRDYIP